LKRHESEDFFCDDSQYCLLIYELLGQACFPTSIFMASIKSPCITIVQFHVSILVEGTASKSEVRLDGRHIVHYLMSCVAKLAVPAFIFLFPIIYE